MKWGHDQLQEDLAAHLRGTRDRVVWTNMQLGPSGSPRPDVYTLPKSFSRFTPLAYEVKISVADFRRDVTSGKWQSYLKFAAGVIFAVPAGLIKKEDVPPGCGLIVRHDEIWRSAKGPTLKATETLPRDTWIKLMIDGLDRQTKEPQPRFANTWNTQKDIRKKYGDSIADALRDLDMAEHRLQIKRVEADRSVDEIVEQERVRTERARIHVEQELGQVRAARHDLCKALGLPEGSPLYSIMDAARKAGERLSGCGEIERVREQLQRAQEALSNGLEPLPMIAHATEWQPTT